MSKNTINKKYITEKKREELKDELEHLMNTRRGEIAKEIERAKGMGDLSENAEYQQAREEQASIEGRISEVKNILKSAEIINHRKSDVVEVGSKVSLRKKYSSKDQDYYIVGSEEANMVEKRISHTSPLGNALMGHKKGDTVELKTPSGEIAVYHIESVE